MPLPLFHLMDYHSGEIYHTSESTQQLADMLNNPEIYAPNFDADSVALTIRRADAAEVEALDYHTMDATSIYLDRIDHCGDEAFRKDYATTVGNFQEGFLRDKCPDDLDLAFAKAVRSTEIALGRIMNRNGL